MSKVDLYTLLSELPKQEFDSPIEFEQSVIPDFVGSLGYDLENLFYEFATGKGSHSLIADGVIAESPESRPWLIIEAKNLKREIRRGELFILRDFVEESNAEYGVLLSRRDLLIGTRSEEIRVDLTEITKKEASEICKILKPPNNLPTEAASSPTPSSERVETENFRLDLGEYERTLTAVEKATTNQEKKESLESLASILFKGVVYLSVRDKNLRTTMSEIDLVVEYNGAEKITAFDAENIAIIVIDGNDLKRVSEGRDFYQAIDEKLYNLRFRSVSNM